MRSSGCIMSTMPKIKIERGMWLTLQLEVTEVWEGDLVTVEFRSAGQKVTLRSDSDEIIEVTKERVKPLFDRRD